MDTEAISADIVTRQVAGQVVNAIATRDWQALAACVDRNVIYWRPGTNDRVDGVERYIDEWRRFANGAARLHYRPHTVIVQGDTAVIEASAEGVAPDGSLLAFSMVSVMRVAHGMLAEEREYIVPASRAR